MLSTCYVSQYIGRLVRRYISFPKLVQYITGQCLIPIDFKLGTRININMKMIPTAWQVSGSRSRPFLTCCEGH